VKLRLRLSPLHVSWWTTESSPSEMGAVGAAGLRAAAIHAELGEIIAGLQPGRAMPQEVTFFGSVGLALQDLAAGWLAYSAARKMQLGRRINLLS
jgi:ornithine cyclodeaminase/alanine dehydrogenase-like protein (mu-crystallin family)